MNSTKTMTTSAIMVALAVVFSLILYLLPFFQFALFLIGIPIIMIGKVADLKMQLVASAAVLLVLGFIDPTFALLVGCIVLPLSIAQGYMLKKDYATSQTIAISSLFMVFGFLGFLYGLDLIFKIDFMSELQLMIDTTVDQTKAVYSTTDMSQSDLATLYAVLEQTRLMVVMLLPSMVFLYSLFTSIVSFTLSKKILERMNIQIKKSYFKDFRIKKQGRLIIMIVLTMIVLMTFMDKGNETFYVSNFMSIFSLILQINALAFIWYLLEKHPKKKGMRVGVMILYFIAPLIPGLNLIRYILSILGFADLYIDFRLKLESRSE